MHDQPSRIIPALESGDDVRRPKPSRVVLWVFGVLLLGGAVFAGAVHSRSLYQKYQSLLARIPALQDSAAAVGRRMDAAEESLRAWTSDRDALRERMARLEQKAQAGLMAARKQTQEMTEHLRQRVQAEMDRRTGVIDARLERIESDRESEQARMARLQEEVAAVRKEMAEQVALAREQSSEHLSKLDGRLASLDERVVQGSRNVNTLSRQLDRRRIDFEVTANRSSELAPGISMKITGASPSYRRVDGWIWLSHDRRTLWVRSHGVQQPLVFYTKQDPRPHELIITQVARRSVAGYLLVPVTSTGTGPSDTSSTLPHSPRTSASE